MIPIEFDQANKVYTKPEGMTDDQCGDLPVYECSDPNGVPVIVSCWELTKEDLEEINITGRLWVIVAGTGLQPMIPQTENPFR